MGKISLYSNDSSVSIDDVLIGTDRDNDDLTKNYPIGSILALVPSPRYVYQITGTSFDTQAPSVLDTALRVEFGSAQSLTNIELDATGQVTFLTAGDYIINAFGDVNRTGSSGGVVMLAWRAVLNGTQFGDPKVFMINDPDTNTPYEITIPFTAAANDRLYFEIMRDSSGVNEGGLYPLTLNGGWGETPSAQIQIWKNE